MDRLFPDRKPELAADLPELWRLVILRCLSFLPQDRPASARALLAELKSPQTMPVVPLPGRTYGKWAIGAVVVLALAGGVVYKTRSGGERQPGVIASQEPEARALLLRYDRPGNLEKAIGMLEAEARSKPDSAVVQSELGWAYWLQALRSQNPADIDKSRQAALLARQMEPDLVQPYLTLAAAAMRAGRLELASEEIQQALKRDRGNASTYNTLALLKDRQGQPKEAREAIDKAKDLAPEDWRWLTTSGSLYAAARDLPHAIADYQKAARLVPDNANVQLALGSIYVRVPDLQGAQRAYERALQLAPGFAAYSGLGSVLLLQGKNKEAAEALEKAVSFNRKSYLTWASLASAHAWEGNSREKAVAAYQEAIVLAEEQRKAVPRDAQLVSYLAGFYAYVGKRDQAVTALRQALALSPESAEVSFRAAEAYELMNRRDDALNLLAKALRLGYPLETVKRSPELASLRGDPRFRVLAREKQ